MCFMRVREAIVLSGSWSLPIEHSEEAERLAPPPEPIGSAKGLRGLNSSSPTRVGGQFCLPVSMIGRLLL